MAWELNPRAPFQINLGLPRAVYQWAEKDPDGLVSWMREVTPKVRELSQKDDLAWFWFSEYVSASLSSLIDARSPHVRELLEMDPLMSAKGLLRGAISRPSFPGGMRVKGVKAQEIIASQIDRFVVNRDELTNEERAWVVHEGAEEILEGHFNGSDQREWQDLLGEANQWLAQFDEEGAVVTA